MAYLGDLRTCIYDDGTTVAMDAGPCQPVLSTGAYLIDDVTEAEGGILRVEPSSMNLTLLAVAGLAVLVLAGGRRS